MSKPFTVEHALAIAVGVSAVGALLAIISLVQLTVVDLGLGGWEYWLIVAGLIVFLIGLYLLIGYLRRASEFDRYMKTASRAEFKKHQDQMEYLAWRLPVRFEKELEEKKKELGIK